MYACRLGSIGSGGASVGKIEVADRRSPRVCMEARKAAGTAETSVEVGVLLVGTLGSSSSVSLRR